MKALLSIGANRPERFRSAAMTPEICAPMPSPEMKSVMAIGSGSTLPLLMSISTSASAGVTPSAAPQSPCHDRHHVSASAYSSSLSVSVAIAARPHVEAFLNNIWLGSKFTTTSGQALYLSRGSFVSGADMSTARCALPFSARFRALRPPDGVTSDPPMAPT